MAQIEEETLQLEEENFDLKDDDFYDFEDDDALRDLKFDIPEKSRICTYYGCSQSEESWEGEKFCDFKIEPFNLKTSLGQPFKFMSSRTIPSAEAVNDYLDEFVENIIIGCQKLNSEIISDEDFRAMVQDLSYNEMTLFDKMTPIENFYVGRIRFGYNKKHLSSRNISLEACISHGNGWVIPLDLSLFKKNTEHDPSKNISLFPGQIVIIKADNPNGNYLRVRKFYPIGQVLKPTFSLKCSPILKSNMPFHIVCASGPVVSLDNPNEDLSNTKYMKALAEYVRSHKPNVLFLCGPIYDSEYIDYMIKWSTKTHSIENGTFPSLCSIEKLFYFQIRAFMKELEGQHLSTKVCYIPSHNELGQNNIYPTYPQKFDSTIPIQYFSNPSFLNLDEITVGINTADVLLHMSRYEISNIQNDAPERMKRLCSHILDHKHFYPIYPADNSLNLEASFYDKLLMPLKPHLLIMPSVFRPFAMEVNQTVVINPGRICQNTIARIKIDPVDPTAYNGSLADYTNAEIIKLI